jgi:RNA polymerase sigma-70 factor (ECF subfamily)
MPATDEPKTRLSLLLRLRDSRDAAAWGDFVDLYAPLVYRQARRAGFQDADAADVTQEVFRAVALAISKFEYDSHRGEFRGWLYRITQNKIRDAAARRQIPGSGDTATHDLLHQQPDHAAATTWDHDFRDSLLDWAYDQVRGRSEERTWQAFWLTAVEGISGEEAAARLGLSIGAVYVAKSRVMVRLKEVLDPWRDELSGRE